MRIYLAGTPGTKERERNFLKFLSSRLLSYWDIQQNQFNVPFSFKLIKQRNK
jgi:hypothetical protein